jgi:hypothetical protein
VVKLFPPCRFAGGGLIFVLENTEAEVQAAYGPKKHNEFAESLKHSEIAEEYTE